MENYPNQSSPVDREISVNPSNVLSCKINGDGIIEYVNHSFSEVSGYEEFEIIGESIDKLRHPDVPNIIYDVIKERLDKNEPVKVLNKQLAKDGRYFWLLTQYETKLNENGEVIAHYSHSVAAPPLAVLKISSLYKILTKIEQKTGNTEVSKRYIIGFLEERNMNYNQFIDDLCAEQPIAQNQKTESRSYIQNTITKDVADPSRITYNANLDVQNLGHSDNVTTTNKRKAVTVKKKKSLLKKVFGK